MAWWLVVLGWYAAWSVAAFVAMGVDKRRASGGGWRVRERTLHSLGLFGGWVGVLVGAWLWRHKCRKVRFLVVAWGVVAVHVVGWGFGLWVAGVV